MRVLRPDWPIGLLSATAIGNLASLDVDFLAVATGLATPGFVRRSQEQLVATGMYAVCFKDSAYRRSSLLR